MRTVLLDTSPLTIEQVNRLARAEARLTLAPDTHARVQASRTRLESTLTDPEPHYGVNTGFGSLSRQRIGPEALRHLQANLVRSHAAGVDEPLPIPVVRAMLAVLAASLARARSAIRPETLETLLALLDHDIIPVVPSVGSVGASGDLAPLAHLALVLMGEGEAVVAGRRTPGAQALAGAGIDPVELDAKEGLALLNGTHLSAARAALVVERYQRLADAALLACAMAIDAAKATHSFLDERVYDLRNQPGPARVAATLREHLLDSQIAGSHRLNDPRVQDPYSFRCAPVVIGAALDAAAYLHEATTRELGAVTDNPLVFDTDPAIVSAGNFHAMPLAIPLDTLAISISHIAGISERRTFWILSAREPESGLHPYLAPHPGIECGLMIAQYTAAACCNELIGLATPASVANIATSAGIEDYNSFAPRAAAKAERALTLAEKVVAIEFVTSAEALDLHRPLRSGPGVERAHEIVRSLVPRREGDRPPAPDIEAVAHAIALGQFKP